MEMVYITTANAYYDIECKHFAERYKNIVAQKIYTIFDDICIIKFKTNHEIIYIFNQKNNILYTCDNLKYLTNNINKVITDLCLDEQLKFATILRILSHKISIKSIDKTQYPLILRRLISTIIDDTHNKNNITETGSIQYLFGGCFTKAFAKSIPISELINATLQLKFDDIDQYNRSFFNDKLTILFRLIKLSDPTKKLSFKLQLIES